jgi:hypothetical protein
VLEQSNRPAGGEISVWPPEPYKGLNYFAAADSVLFSQRQEIDEVVAITASFDTRVLLLHGGSGTGKSSFLRAGLLPRLEKMPRDYGYNFFLPHEVKQDGSVGDPLLIRATDDPIARVFGF